MYKRSLAAMACAVLAGCAVTMPSARPFVAALPEVQQRVDKQVASLRVYCDVQSVERLSASDPKQGWLISYRQTDQTLAGPRATGKWLKLGAEGYVAACSPGYD